MPKYMALFTQYKFGNLIHYNIKQKLTVDWLDISVYQPCGCDWLPKNIK